MPPLFRRFGRPGLLGTVGRTAVIAGTATMTARAVNRGMARRDQTREEAELYEAEATQPLAAAQPAAAQPAAEGLAAQLQSISQLHASGAISDEEFASAKRKLLG